MMKRVLLCLSFVLALFAFASCSSTPSSDSDKTFIVSFDSNGGNFVEAQRVPDGELVTVPKDPTKDGYTFDGWFVGKEEWSFKNDKVTADITLTAHWTVNTETLPEIEPEAETHICKHICPICGKCLDANCTDPKCADKCQGHETEEVKENEVKVQSIKVVDLNASSEGLQYVLLPVDKNEVTFTIKLSNPKAYQIDSLRLYCEDGLAEIKIDGQWKPLNIEQDGSRVVNWSSEDAYEKTFYLRMHSTAAHNVLRVLDVRLAGHTEWQSSETKSNDLGNNELNIFKLSTYDFQWVFVDNVEEYYAWKMNHGDKISNLVVKADGEVLSANNGEYRVTKDCKVTWEYDYSCDGVTIHESGEKDIELLKIIYAAGIQYYGLIYDWRIYAAFSGTDTQIENIYDIKNYPDPSDLTILLYGDSNGYNIIAKLTLIPFDYELKIYYLETIDTSIRLGTDLNYYLKIGNRFYYLNCRTNKLEIVNK